VEILLITVVFVVLVLCGLVISVLRRVENPPLSRREQELEAQIAKLETTLVAVGFRFEEGRVVGGAQPVDAYEEAQRKTDRALADLKGSIAGLAGDEGLGPLERLRAMESQAPGIPVEPAMFDQLEGREPNIFDKLGRPQPEDLPVPPPGAFGTPGFTSPMQVAGAALETIAAIEQGAVRERKMVQEHVEPNGEAPPRPAARYGLEPPLVPTDKPACLNCTSCSWEAGQDALRSHGPFAQVASLQMPAKLLNKVLRDEEGKPLPDEEQPPLSVPVDATWDQFIGCKKHSDMRYGLQVCPSWTPQPHVRHLKLLPQAPAEVVQS
jgi:hypothetical protein